MTSRREGARESVEQSLGHLTFKGNRGHSRHDWLRLTPAYSVQMVERILDDEGIDGGTVLDPFCGSGTTALVCAERGISADTTDINPFLLWLSTAKSRAYSASDRRAFVGAAKRVGRAMASSRSSAAWVPPLHQIEKWWSRATLSALALGYEKISKLESSEPRAVTDLLKVAFCRTMIGRAHVSFGHQSMSFKRRSSETESEQGALARTWSAAVALVLAGAEGSVLVPPRTLFCDARELASVLAPGAYRAVITSPPYPNRMSYVRELRPYMYWLGFLDSGKGAGELDWRAIGGTWGSATSNLGKWSPEPGQRIPFRGFESRILRGIAETSPLLATYVRKYFHDMQKHCESLHGLVARGGSVHYIVGNSKFYDVLLPAERILSAQLVAAGFRRARVRTIRKRSSKKELYEFVVSADR